MADFDFVTTRVATGAAINGPEDVQALIDAGVTDVINCRAESTDADVLKGFAQIIGYLSIGVQDDGQPKPPEWFQQGIEFGLKALLEPHRKVYAHCAAGVNRGPSMCFAILRAIGMNPTEAEAQIRAHRSQVGLAYKEDANKAITLLGYE